MEMGRRAEDLEIDVLFLFLSLFADGEFATFGPPGMEWDSMRGGRLSLQVGCGGGRGGRTGLVKVGSMGSLSCHLGRLFSSDIILLFFWLGGDGSARVQIARICSSGREESRRACSTSSGERPEIGFPSAASAGGVFTKVESCREIFVLILADRGMLLRRRSSFGPARFS